MNLCLANILYINLDFWLKCWKFTKHRHFEHKYDFKQYLVVRLKFWCLLNFDQNADFSLKILIFPKFRFPTILLWTTAWELKLFFRIFRLGRFNNILFSVACKPVRHLLMLKVVLALVFSAMQILEISTHEMSDHAVQYSSAFLFGIGLCSAAYCWFFRWSSGGWRNFSHKSKLFMKKLKFYSKIESLAKNQNFGKNIVILVKNWKFCQKLKFCSKMKIFEKNGNFG